MVNKKIPQTKIAVNGLYVDCVGLTRLRVILIIYLNFAAYYRHLFIFYYC